MRATLPWPAAAALLAGCLCTACASSRPGDDDAALAAGFVEPPAAARPWVYWFVMDGNLSREGITADLEAMARAGLGGVILMEVDVGIARGPVQFQSPAWQALFAHAVAECQRLGLQLTLNAGPGWTGSGGPWVQPEQGMQHLVASVTEVEGPRRFDGVLPQAPPRPPFFGDAQLPAGLRAAKDAFWRDVAVLAFPTPAPGARLELLDEKALYVRAPYSSQRGVLPSLPAPAVHDEPPAAQVVAADAVVDLSDRLLADGRLAWDVPPGRWTILRCGRTSTGANTRPAPQPGLGLECDKFAAAALDAHFAAYVAPLLAACGTPNAGGAGWTSLHLDSWEMSAQNWSAGFAAAFAQRRGYDPRPWLPVLTGVLVGGRGRAERFLWDLRQTAQELVVEQHARHLRELGRRHGLGLSIEPYDMNPTADLSLGGEADVPMGEFWSLGFDTAYSCFEAASLGHTHGREVVAAEAFTADDRERWRLHPGALKAQADWALATGINRVVFHRYQHQPRLDAFPGMTMGPYGVHWERTQTWWELVPAFHRYLARCQFLLRAGVAVTDLCFVVPEGAPQVFVPPRSATTGTLPDHRGFAFDGCAPELVRTAMTVREGQLALPGGARYRLLVLPAVPTMTPELLAKVVQLVVDGATVVGAPPQASPSLAGYPACDAEVRRLAAQLWGDGPAPAAVTVRPVGRGRVVWGGPIGRTAAPSPAPLGQAQWIWDDVGEPARSAPPGERAFRREFTLPAGRAVAAARLAMTADNAFTLTVNGAVVASGDDFHQLVDVDVARQLVPGANLLTVTARNDGDAPNPAGLVGNLVVRLVDGGELQVPTDGAWQVAPGSGGPWRSARGLGAPGMAPWGRDLLAAPPPELYPGYELLAGLLAADGVAPDCAAAVPVRFAHRVVGDLDLYFVANPEPRPFAADVAFRATGRQPELWDPQTGEQRPLPDWRVAGATTVVPLQLPPHGSCFLVFRRAASSPPAATDGAAAPRRNFAATAPVATVDGPWRVAFQPGRGAPAEITLAALADWSRHEDDGVRHFAGVATCTTAFDLPAGFQPAGRVFVDLGDVQVMAAVRLNGHDLGVTWTTPFRLPATAALRPGRNELEVRVANLWPNRLIGDVALPPSARVATTTWNPFTADTPLLPSGLLGPVTLQVEVTAEGAGAAR